MLYVNFLYSEIQALLEEFPCQIRLNVAITRMHCNKFGSTLCKQHLIWFVKKDRDKRLIPVAHIMNTSEGTQMATICSLQDVIADSR